MCEVFHCHWGKLELTGFRAGRNHANHTVCFDMKWRVGKIGDSPLLVSFPWNLRHWKFPLAWRKWSCSYYLIKQGVLFFLQSFIEGLELIFFFYTTKNSYNTNITYNMYITYNTNITDATTDITYNTTVTYTTITTNTTITHYNYYRYSAYTTDNTNLVLHCTLIMQLLFVLARYFI